MNKANVLAYCSLTPIGCVGHENAFEPFAQLKFFDRHCHCGPHRLVNQQCIVILKSKPRL